MKTKFVIYIPVNPRGGTHSGLASLTCSGAKQNVAKSSCVTWGKLLTQGWRVVKFEGRKGAK